jgi:hypothetical protein
LIIDIIQDWPVMVAIGGALLSVGWAVSQMDKKSAMFSNSKPLKLPSSTPQVKQSAKSHEDAVIAVQSVLRVRGYIAVSEPTPAILANKKIRIVIEGSGQTHVPNGFEFATVFISVSLNANRSGTYAYWRFDSEAGSLNKDYIEETDLTSKALLSAL